ncbi:glycosyltransferase family 2 protein [Winogradskyella jejuensis]|uniref:Glycosyltransferase involved in cell wall bisynthesis n=1 Tax=Winogradskyella jejuensis TaxID=1089305 RepID=A0A1M5SJF8_9FLAO|nr:glycosyltransferase family 2 protein [Winogradskyella jejuensis]SHH38585.1 Glycosyltransferase involved in cell wall bisynthesis [Winogradskyella jejuensis]
MEVSVIMITYNHEKYIKQAVESIVNQVTNFDFELIIADDNSKDDTEQAVKSVSNTSKNLNLRYFRNEENLGMTKNFEYAYSKSNGNFIAICEGDDYWNDKNKLQKQVDFLRDNPSYSFCYTRFKVYKNDNDSFVEDFNGKHFHNDSKFVPFTYQTFSEGWHIGNQTLVFRKENFNAVAFKKFKNFKDVHLISQLLKKGEGACLNFFGAVYRMHDGGIHTSVTEYNGYKIGYLTHKEIYLDNASNQYLRRKYLHSYKNFLNANIRANHLSTALWMSIDLLFKNGKVIDFLKHIKRILVKLFGKK